MRKKALTQKHIIVTGEKHGLPYSKGLMASSIMATGLPPMEAYRVAQKVENELKAEKIFQLTINELNWRVAKILSEEVGVEFAERFKKWAAFEKLDKAIILMIGGTTGVGKSTLASEVAHRLGITRIVSTDAIREIMRMVYPAEVIPALHVSSFEADKVLRIPVPPGADPLILGFREQTSIVVQGIKAEVKRVITEGINAVVEGVHIVPGYIDFIEEFKDRAVIIPLIVWMEDEDAHRSHFFLREIDTEGRRPYEKYRQNFERIRKIGEFVKGLALERNIPVVNFSYLDTAVNDVLQIVFQRVFSSSEALRESIKQEGEVDVV